RWRATRTTRANALAGIRDVGYDAAIDLASHYPNSARLLCQASIPVRIGYESGGDGPLFTQAVPWSGGQHVTEEHRFLVEQLTRSVTQRRPIRYDLGEIPPGALARVRAKLADANAISGEYVVVHMGAGHARKEWPVR